MAYVKSTCSEESCERNAAGRGLCRTHYSAAKRRGSLPTEWERKLETREEIFQRNVEKTDGCWNWKGATSSAGYGLIGERGYAHRVSLELATGRKLGGSYVDHICHNPACVNPEHLRAVTQKQNMENHSGAKRSSKSGVRGVWFVPRWGHWTVQVTHNYQRYSGGNHRTLEAAEAAAIALRNKLFTHNDADRLTQ